MEVTTREDGRRLKARGSRVDYALYGAEGVRLADGNGSARCGSCWCVPRMAHRMELRLDFWTGIWRQYLWWRLSGLALPQEFNASVDRD